MTGRSGASPIPPATMTTSRPYASSTGQPRPSGPRSAEGRAPAEPGQEARRRAGGADRQLDAVRVEARDGDRRDRERGHPDHDELAGPAGQDPRVVRREPERRRVGGLGGHRDHRRRRELQRVLGDLREREDVVAREGRAAGAGARRRPGDRVELGADIDADRAPRDAAAAADAARRPELVPPGRELVGEPLPVAVLVPRPEAAAGDLGEPVGEARVPGPDRARRTAVEAGL